jgi:very-short-patch-repair endonuclease
MDERQRARLPTTLLGHARDMRTAATDAEHCLWQRLRSRQLAGLKFRRQHPIPPYIADFYCDRLRLVIEVDGSQHSPAGDARRTTFLESRGLAVLRFNANDVILQTDAVLQAILNIANVPPLTPTPLPAGEGLQTEAIRHDD